MPDADTEVPYFRERGNIAHQQHRVDLVSGALFELGGLI